MSVPVFRHLKCRNTGPRGCETVTSLLPPRNCHHKNPATSCPSRLTSWEDPAGRQEAGSPEPVLIFQEEVAPVGGNP